MIFRQNQLIPQQNKHPGGRWPSRGTSQISATGGLVSARRCFVLRHGFRGLICLGKSHRQRCGGLIARATGTRSHNVRPYAVSYSSAPVGTSSARPRLRSKQSPTRAIRQGRICRGNCRRCTRHPLIRPFGPPSPQGEGFRFASGKSPALHRLCGFLPVGEPAGLAACTGISQRALPFGRLN